MPILEKLTEFFQQFAIQKYSSNVIEKCVERADDVYLLSSSFLCRK